MIELMKLPYKQNALEPVISSDTVALHYEKHHQGYVDNLNKLIKGTIYEDMSLEDMIYEAHLEPENLPPTPVFNNAAQVYNHNVYWESLDPQKEEMSSKTREHIEDYFTSVDNLKTSVVDAAKKHFGSGWVWLCMHQDKSLFVYASHDAATPIVDPSATPLFVIDVWEHAYYLDYKNDRAKYVEAVWTVLNWRLIGQKLGY